ncbi:hypothetical protein JSY36_04345 [Bacillus sp. H-16]|uniref:hypothetical protein n=1 Tax=Alteribacter salitolerans TaxID=2912333 RepID=UPI0019644941|nr:hypothetical protein [Alteribacter salitolerans]MBM7094981.1 hypothetical protein [Alteribacter salitolerans]
MDLKTAYEIMDVSKEVTIEQLEDQYLLWIKKLKAQQDKTKTTDSNVAIDIGRITEAYHVIKRNIQPENSTTMNAREKMEYFFEHYKFHTLAILSSVFIFGAILYNFIDYRIEQSRLADILPPDLEILFLGEYYADDSTVISEAIEQEFPKFENVEVKIEYIPATLTSEMDIASTQRIPIILMSETPDIYITDQTQFDFLLSMEPFQSLDLPGELEQNLPYIILEYYQGETDEKELYGVDISESAIFTRVEIGGAGKIAAIRSGADQQDNALAFMEKAIQELPETE